MYCEVDTCKIRDKETGICLFGTTPEYQDFNRLPDITVCKERQDYEQWLSSIDRTSEDQEPEVENS